MKPDLRSVWGQRGHWCQRLTVNPLKWKNILGLQTILKCQSFCESLSLPSPNLRFQTWQNFYRVQGEVCLICQEWGAWQRNKTCTAQTIFLSTKETQTGTMFDCIPHLFSNSLPVWNIYTCEEISEVMTELEQPEDLLSPPQDLHLTAALQCEAQRHTSY